MNPPKIGVLNYYELNFRTKAVETRKEIGINLLTSKPIPISYYISVDVIKHLHLFLYNEGSNWPDVIPIGLSHPFDKQSAIPLL